MDFDNDGVKDLILGDRSGYINFYKRSSGMVLDRAIQLTDANGVIKVDNNSKPTIVDWNGDGLLDMFISSGGNTSTSTGSPIRLYINKGSIETYKYSDYIEISVGSEILRHERCYSQIIDLNKDGLLDLVASSKVYIDNTIISKIFYYENSGGTGLINLKPGKPLYSSENTPIEIYSDAHFCFSNWDNDGVEDLIWTQYPFNTPKDYVYVSTGSRPVNLNDMNIKKGNCDDFNLTYHNGFLNLRNNAGRKFELKIYSLSGEKIASVKKCNDNIIHFNNRLANGTYIVKILSHNRRISKLIIINE